MLVEGIGGDGEDLGLVGAGRHTANVDPIGVLAVLPEVKIHGVDGVVHGGVFAGVSRSPAHAAVVFVGPLEDAGGYSCGVDRSHSFINLYINR